MTSLTPQELKTKIDAGETMNLIDIRDGHTYQEKHIPGAMNIPFNDAFGSEASAALPDKDVLTVLYFDFDGHDEDQQAAGALEGLGFKNVATLKDGIMGWMNAGFPVEFGRES